MELLFVYGTLRDAKTQRRIFGRSASGTPDTLPDYRKRKVRLEGKFYPIAARSKNRNVGGFVISVTKSELKKIDRYETSAYRRIAVKLKSGKRAWVYVKSR